MGNEVIRRVGPILKKPQAGEKEMVVRLDNVQYQGDTAIVSEKALVDSLIKHGEQTLQVLSLSVAPLRLDDITLDDSMRVVISNPNFVHALKVRPPSQLTMYNTYCSNYSCS